MHNKGLYKKKKDIEKNLHPKIAINNKGSFR